MPRLASQRTSSPVPHPRSSTRSPAWVIRASSLCTMPRRRLATCVFENSESYPSATSSNVGGVPTSGHVVFRALRMDPAWLAFMARQQHSDPAGLGRNEMPREMDGVRCASLPFAMQRPRVHHPTVSVDEVPTRAASSHREIAIRPITPRSQRHDAVRHLFVVGGAFYGIGKRGQEPIRHRPFQAFYRFAQVSFRLTFVAKHDERPRLDSMSLQKLDDLRHAC